MLTTTDPDLTRLSRAMAGSMRPSSDYDLNPSIRLPEGRKLRPAGVLIGLLPGERGREVLLTKRSSRLRHHPGQIAFPGGRQDPEDADVEACALREAREEVGLDPTLAQVMGRLTPHETVTSFNMTPVVAEVTARFDPVPQPGEVEEVFTVPLAHLMDPANYRIEGRRWQGSRRHYYVVPYGPYYIWGATARVLKRLADAWVACP